MKNPFVQLVVSGLSTGLFISMSKAFAYGGKESLMWIALLLAFVSGLSAFHALTRLFGKAGL